MSDYEPTEFDIDWAREMMRVNRSGGLIMFPSTNLFYRKQNNQLVLINGDARHECHQRTIKVFTQAGFVVVERQEPKG